MDPRKRDEQTQAAEVEIHPLTAERWDDLAALFGKGGAYSGCWCMWWRLPGREYSDSKAAERHEMFRAIVAEGQEPGLLAYLDGRPVGWCAVAPDEQFAARRARSRYWKPVDDAPVWSIVCFYVARDQRGRGVASQLLAGAIRFAREHGAAILEGYPKEPSEASSTASSLYRGTAAMFRTAGFREVMRRHPEAPIMRLQLRPARTSG